MRVFRQVLAGVVQPEVYAEGCVIGDVHFGEFASDASYAEHGLYRQLDDVPAFNLYLRRHQ